MSTIRSVSKKSSSTKKRKSTTEGADKSQKKPKVVGFMKPE
jgi:hypothetical protein